MALPTRLRVHKFVRAEILVGKEEAGDDQRKPLYVSALHGPSNNKVPRRGPATIFLQVRFAVLRIIWPYGEIICRCACAMVERARCGGAGLDSYGCFSATISRTSGVIMSESVVSACSSSVRTACSNS